MTSRCSRLHADAGRRAERQRAEGPVRRHQHLPAAVVGAVPADCRGCSNACSTPRGVIRTLARGSTTDASLLGDLTLSTLDGTQRRAAEGVRQAGGLDPVRAAPGRDQHSQLAAHRHGGAAAGGHRPAGLLHAAGRGAVPERTAAGVSRPALASRSSGRCRRSIGSSRSATTAPRSWRSCCASRRRACRSCRSASTCRGTSGGESAERAFPVGYFARVAPEKGLQELARAYVAFRRRAGRRATRA